MFALLPEAAKMMAAKTNASTISTSRATSPLGRETKSSCSNMRDRSGGRPIELVADPIVEGGGSDQFGRKLVYVAHGQALTAPDDDPADEGIQLVEKLQVQEGPHEGRGAARGDLAAVRLLELVHRVGKLAFEQRRVVSVNLGQGA